MADQQHDPFQSNQTGDEQGGGNDVTPSNKDSTNLAMLAHLLGIVTSVLGALIIWLIKKDEDPFIDDQAKEALNFQITVLIAYAGVGVLTCVTFGLGGILAPIVWVVSLIFSILAAVAASRGEQYRYPVALRLLK